MSNKIPTVNHDITEPWWGLKRSITPCFGARLVQSGNCLHYLADRASITGQFSDGDLRHLDQAFPLLLKQLELMLTSGELTLKWFTEFGHLNRGDMLTSEQHRCHNEKKKFQRRV